MQDATDLLARLEAGLWAAAPEERENEDAMRAAYKAMLSAQEAE